MLSFLIRIVQCNCFKNIKSQYFRFLQMKFDTNIYMLQNSYRQLMYNKNPPNL